MATACAPLSPGEILIKDFLKPNRLSQNALARAIDVPTGRINDIVRGKRGVTSDTAVRLSIYFKTTVEFWIDMQAKFDAKMAERHIRPRIEKSIRARPVSPA